MLHTECRWISPTAEGERHGSPDQRRLRQRYTRSS
jgi:hypothetical protein